MQVTEKRRIVVAPNIDDISRRGADFFLEFASTAMDASGRFAVALAGGSTPRQLYSVLASEVYRPRVDWERVHFFWGDERCVPPDDPRSNYRMFREAFLEEVQVPESNIHRVPVEGREPEEAAREYEEELRRFFQTGSSPFPRFDLILLGMGEDGHVASLFPGTSALQEKERWVVASEGEGLAPPRVTLTLPVINRAAHVVFLVAGDQKAGVVRRFLEDRKKEDPLPAQLVEPVEGNLYLLLDRWAASQLKDSGGHG